MAVFRCLIATSFLTNAEWDINRPFRVGDEIVTDAPLDELVIGRRGPHFHKVTDNSPKADSKPKPLSELTVKELHEIAVAMGVDPAMTKEMKKMELVAFLDGYDPDR